MSNGFLFCTVAALTPAMVSFSQLTMNNTSGQRLPQGFQNSPTLYHQAVRRDLCDPECPVKQSTMIQYVDDI